MARLLGLIFGLVLAVVGVLISTPAGAAQYGDYYATQADAYAACLALKGRTGSCSFTAAPGPGGDTSCPSRLHAGFYVAHSNGPSDGSAGPMGDYSLDWCVPADCSVYDTGSSSQQWDAVYSEGGVYCNGGCMSVFHGQTGVSSIQFPDGTGGAWGHFVGNGNRCNNATDAGLLKHAKAGDLTCDPGQLSCYSPTKGFCATTQSGEQVCTPAPPPGQGSCTAGATGATCAGTNTPPPPPSDPPIAKNTPPDGTTNTTGKDAAGNTYNYTTNNYSGTSPGGGGAPPSGSSSGAAGSQSNANGSGNSGSKGTDSNGNCPDGKVPTASGCSGTATDTGCDAPPQAYGDAILAESFKELVAIRCNTQKPASGSSINLGTPSDALAAAGVPADGGASGDPSASGLVTSSDLGQDGFDASGLGFSRTCPANPTFNVLGHAYTLDLTPFCNFASLLGWFVLLCAFLVGLRVVATGKA